MMHLRFFFCLILMIYSHVTFARDTLMQPLPSLFYLGAAIGSDGHGFPFNIFGGYGKTLGESQNYYLGWEATAYTTPANHGTGPLYGAGLSILPGFWFTPSTLGFLRAGVLAAKLNSPNQNHIGDQFGLGVQTEVTPHVDARCEYIFREYNSLHNVDTSNTIDSNEIDLGIVYKLD